MHLGPKAGQQRMQLYQPTRGGQNVSDKNENGTLRAELDALADDIHKLAHCQV